MKILILGHRGMLGNAVYKYLSQFHDVDTIDFRWPSNEFIQYIENYKGDFIINCIGAIPQKTNDFGINSVLPIYLDLNTRCKIIHPSTDCEIDNTLYGISKRIATDWITSYGQNTYIFKTSIIGIELNSSDSLLCWFLNQSKVHGYTQAKWNGITTLEWAKQCKHFIDNNLTELFITYGTSCISKFELLTIINDVYNCNTEIIAVDGIGKNKCLISDIKLSTIEQQLIELKEFYEN
jgi:dTDP-4-dehydrorhamnose reductase